MFVYHEDYDLDWAEHIFPTEKYRLLRTKLLEEGIADEKDIYRPEPASEDEILLVHDKAYLERLRSLTAHPHLAVWEFEAPITEKTLKALYLCTGGTIMAAKRAASESRIWMNIGGGFHHAFSEHGEGFCFINDVAVAARVLQRDTDVERIIIVDCDLHQGNGTAKIFEDDPSVFTFSIHEQNIYPIKQRSDIDIGLESFTEDEEYLILLQKGLETAFKEPFDFVFYLAGADPFKEDRLGSLLLSKEGLKRRDEVVFDFADTFGLAVCVLLAGGYALRTEDVVEIHANTARSLVQHNGKRTSL